MIPFFAITLIAAAAPAAATPSPSALFAAGDFPAATAAYEARLRANSADSADRLNLAAIRVYENDLSAAEPLLDAILYADPQNVRASNLLAELQRRRAEAARRTTLTGGESVVPFVTADPLPVVRVVANGVPANFLVDTGASVVLETSFAARIGVKTASAGQGVFAGGQHAPVAKGMLQSLALGTATAYDVPVGVMVTHVEQLIPQIHIDGIVGTTYFERFLVTMDYPRN
ncbi:MAG TPA: aspartyl protease family protein, partial [Candidatus Nitrosotalea sp.]|nr:aspartyl protease family protein [Candidatus Nitrosotalea sp.]